ncbi:hypothetical protein [Albidovulum sp.]|uniref:hypothetical protein n=1 Tax=Albidovulum sp. TaxID=1872424 RepID=UPI0025C1C125|nr:hypothetical protein [Defluviimonas sp.]
MANPLDAAIAAEAGEADAAALASYTKVDEVPCDFVRKRLSVVVRVAGETDDLLICKGAVESVAAACDWVLDGAAARPLDAATRETIETRLRDWSRAGFRTLGLAIRRLPRRAAYGTRTRPGSPSRASSFSSTRRNPEWRTHCAISPGVALR